MIRVIDRNDEVIVQKVVTPKGAARYQVVRLAEIGNSERVTVCSSLTAARAMIGKGQNGRPLTAGSNG